MAAWTFNMKLAVSKTMLISENQIGVHAVLTDGPSDEVTVFDKNFTENYSGGLAGTDAVEAELVKKIKAEVDDYINAKTKFEHSGMDTMVTSIGNLATTYLGTKNVLIDN